MISSVNLQNKYIALYAQIRKYVWGFDAINALADLEVAIYSRFPDTQTVKSTLNKFKIYLKSVIDDDDDLKKAVDDLEDLVDNEDTFFAKLTKLQEVVK